MHNGPSRRAISVDWRACFDSLAETVGLEEYPEILYVHPPTESVSCIT